MEEKRLNEEEVDLRDYLKVMGKRKWTIIITLLVCLAVAAIFTFSPRPVYRASSVFEIGSSLSGPLMSPQATVSLCKSDYLLSKVKEILNLPKEKKIKIKAGRVGSMVTVSLDFSSTEKAVKIVNTITNLAIKEQDTIYQEKVRELEKEAEEIQKKIALTQRKKGEPLASLVNLNYLQQLQSRFNEIQGQLTSFRETKVVFPATIPDRPIKPRPAFNLAISIILGLFLGIFLAFSQEYLSKT